MAAYAATVTLSTPRPERLNRLAIAFGQVNITNYNQTLAEITGISKLFPSGKPIAVIFSGSAAGYNVLWDAAAKSAKVYTSATTQTANDTAVGVCDFVAIGYW